MALLLTYVIKLAPRQSRKAGKARACEMTLIRSIT